MQVIIDYIVRGGPLMPFIILDSIIGLAIVIERIIFLNKVEKNLHAISGKVKERILQNDLRGAVKVCEVEKGVSSNIFKVILVNVLNGARREEIERNIADITKIELPALQRYLPTLSTTVSIAPMLGLLGTVTGMIKSALVLAEQGISNPSALIAGIAEALITTAAGLIVAIPLLIAYNSLSAKVNKIMDTIEANIAETLIILSQKSQIW